MRTITILCLLCAVLDLYGAASLPKPVGYVGMWPEPWFGKTRGTDPAAADPNPIMGDTSHGYDYGQDQWGYWANIEIEDPITANFSVIEMRYIPVEAPDYGNGIISGALLMGAPREEQGSRPEEEPQVVVPLGTINGGRGMWVSANECTQYAWQYYTSEVLSDKNQAYFKADEVKSRAVDQRNYQEVTDFCTAVSAVIGKTVGLPTEAEWEFLCRSGTATAFYTGRILDGVTGSINFNISTKSSDFMFDFSEADIAADIPSIPLGDVTTPPWIYVVSSINAQGTAAWGGFNKGSIREICGKITIDGSSTVTMATTAHFDSRYQHRYLADNYGLYTPVLMVYKKIGTEYKPMPFGNPSEAGMYYRLLDDKSSYLEVATYEAQLKQQNHPGNMHGLCPDPIELTPFWLQKSDRASDWYSSDFTNPAIVPQQLEYREMVPAYVRYMAPNAGADTRNVIMAEWVEAFDGTHVLVSEPGLSSGSYVLRMHPLRSMYTQYRYYDSGTSPADTLPVAVPAAAIEAAALATVPDNEKGKNNPGLDMTTAGYIKYYSNVVSDYYQNNVLKKDFWVPATKEEIDNINKNDIVDFGKSAKTFISKVEILGAENVTTSTADIGRSPWGLINMHGNLEEWTATNWDGTSNHGNHSGGAFQVTRGGSLKTGADRCRSAARTARDPARTYDDVGFRFVIRN